MKKSTIKKIVVIATIIMLLLILGARCYASIRPDQLQGDLNDTIEIDFIKKVEELLQKMGIILSVAVLMIIGIKYMVGSVEEKANYKKSMMPYIIGCFFVFGASLIGTAIEDTFENVSTVDDMSNKVLGLIQVVGTYVAVAMIMVLGIKYMLGSSEERAEYKRSMLPYIIGAILLFAAVNIASMIYDFIGAPGVGDSSGSSSNDYLDSKTSGYGELSDADKEKTVDEIKAEREEAIRKRTEAYKKDPNGEEFKKWQKHVSDLDEWLKWNS